MIPKCRALTISTLVLILFTASAAYGICETGGASKPTVGLTYTGPNQYGKVFVQVTYSFPNTGEGPNSYLGRKLEIYRDGIKQWSDLPANSSGTTPPIEIPFACLATGTHMLVATARACGSAQPIADYYAETPPQNVPINTTPTVSISTFGPDAAGKSTVTVKYNFPNTSSYLNRLIQFNGTTGSVPGSHRPLDTQGDYIFQHASDCAKSWHVTAIACEGSLNYTAEDTETQEERKPEVKSVSLLKIGLDGSTPPKPIFEVTVAYDLKSPGSVQIDLENWLNADGQLIAGGPLKTYQVPGSEVPANPPSGTKVFTFVAPSGAQHPSVTAKATTACGTAKKSASTGCGICPGASANPVYYSDGNMSLSDGDPLPAVAGRSLSRTYNSDEQVVALFGRGWTTFLDRRIIVHTSAVSVISETNEVVRFEPTSGVYRQTWPTAQRTLGTLTQNAAASTYTYRAPGATEVAVFRASDGRIVAIRDAAAARDLAVGYDAQARPVTVTDVVTEVAWNLTFDGSQRRVTSIGIAGRPDLIWSYSYDGGGNLTTVLAPGSVPWRTYEYAANRMTASRDPLGNLIESHTYDSNGFAISSTGDVDEIANLEYGLPGSVENERLTRVTYRSGAVAEHRLRPIGNGWRAVQVSGGCASCGTHDATYVHDERGRVIREQGADGYITETVYNGDHVLSEARFLKPTGCDPQTDPQRCRRDSDALAAAALEPTSASFTATYEYADPLWPDRTTKIRLPSIVWPSQFRDENRLYHASTGALTRHEHRALGDALLSRDTSWTFYEGTGTVPVFDPGGVFQSGWMSLPQPLNLVQTVNGPRTDVQDITSYVYYPIDNSVPALLRSRLAAVKNAAGHITRYESYDVFGNATRVVDPNGVATEMTFDALGRPLTTTTKAIAGCNTTLDPLCSTDVTTTRVYSPASGPLARVTNPRGGVTVYTYDDRGRLQTLSRGNGVNDLSERIETTYDPLTGKKSHESRLGLFYGEWIERWSQSFVYDNHARLESVVHADGAAVHYTYDAADRVATVRDENHAAPNTMYAYDPAGRVSRVTQTLATQPGGSISTQYTYDLDGNVTSVTDPNGNVTTYSYSDLGDLAEQTSPVTGETSYGYDEAGNLRSTVDGNGIKTTREYDGLNRVINASSKSSSLGEAVTWSYDDATLGRFGIGRLTSSTDPSGDVSYSYERRGLLRKETRNVSLVSQTHTTSYTYDADGNRNGITYPSGRLVQYGFDYAGRPTSATGAVVDASYLPFGPLANLRFANNTQQFLSYDARYRMTGNSLFTYIPPPGKPVVLASYTYNHDDAGNITLIRDRDSTYNRGFEYDDLNRLIVANTGSSLWQTGSYSWDAMGNLKNMSLGTAAGRSSTLAYDGTTPKLASVTTNTAKGVGVATSVEYDAAGNETSYIATRSYSPRNLTEEVVGTGPSPRRMRNSYDGRGIRIVSETTMGLGTVASRTYLYSPELQLMAVTAPNLSTIDYEIVWFAGRPVAQISSTGTRYTFADHLGTPIIQTSGQTIIWRAEYEPFGNIFKMRTGTSTDQPLRFPGQEVAFSWEGQEENYNIHRWYRSGWGRYTQADPLGLYDATNLFAYVGSNPLVWADPSGTVKWSKNAPIYSTSYQDDVFHHCGAASYKAGGCTDPTGSGSKCKCPCESGGNKLQISMTLNLHVWARYDDPRATVAQIFAEEQKHIVGWTQVFDQFIKTAESYEKIYDSPDACWDACKEFVAKFKAAWKKSISDVDKTHPKLGGGL